MARDPSKIVLVTDPRIPEDRFIFDGVDVSREPVFTVSEVAKFFFARSAHWVRWRERKGFFVLDDKEFLPSRTDTGARQYNLADIEKMAHALASQGVVNGSQLKTTLLLLQGQAKLWGYF